MKRHSQIIILASSILAIFGFSMPWLKMYDENHSGIKLTHLDENYSVYVVIAFILTLFIILISLHIMARKKPLRLWFKLLVLTMCWFGFCCCLAIFAGLWNEERFYRLEENDVGFGVFITAIGFILVSAGVLSSNKNHNGSNSH